MAETKETIEIIKEELAVAAENLKKIGVELAEDVLMKVMLEMNATTKRVVVRTPNKIDDLYLVVEQQVVSVAESAIDKIDGEEG